MTLDRDYGEDPGEVRLVECPFCGEDLLDEDAPGDGTQPPKHLRRCDEFHAAWGDDRQQAAGGRRRSRRQPRGSRRHEPMQDGV